MKNTKRNQIWETNSGRKGQSAHARVIILALVSFTAGLGIGAMWFSRQPPTQVISQAAPPVSIIKPVVHAPYASAGIAPAAAVGAVHTPDPVVLEAVKRTLPNLEKTTEETGTVILRKAAVTEFEKAARAFREERKKIEAELSKLPEGEQKLAAKRLLEMQNEQAAKLKQIAANSKAQIEAFQELKASAQ